jgi:hypothetical protein
MKNSKGIHNREKCAMSKRYIFMVMILMLALAIFACAMPGSQEAAGTVESVVAEVAEQAEEAAVAEVAEPAAEETAVAETGEETTGGEVAAGGWGSLDELDSYRIIMRTSMQSPDGSWTPSSDMEIAVVNSPPPHAEHFIMRDPLGNTMMELITIGDMSWMNIGGTWMSVPAGGSDIPTAGAPADFALPEDITSSMELVGTEVVNGINCEHYTFDVIISSEALAGMMGGASTGGDMPTSDTHTVGETWVAAEPGLPPIAIRSDTTQSWQASEGVETVMRMEYELSDINQPITIEPPPTP